MQKDYAISTELYKELTRFIGGYDVYLLKENLRRLLVDFLDYGLEVGVPLYFDKFFYPFNALLDVLEIAAEEKRAYRQPLIDEILSWPEKDSKEKVIKFLKGVLQPQQVFLLYHFKEPGKVEQYDLLVVIPSSSKTSFSYYEQVLTMAYFEEITINVSLHKAEMIEQQLREGHVFYTMVCNRSNLLYDSDIKPFVEPSKADLNAVKEKATQTFNAALRKAQSFLKGANEYYGSNNLTMAAFMLQQVVELSLYAIIMALLGQCPKTHYFNELKKPLRRCAPEIEYIISPDEAEENRLLLALEKAYLESRYANNFNISNHDLTFLLGAAQELMEKVTEVFRDKISEI